MGKWKIYKSDGTPLTDVNGKEMEIHSLQYNGEWMGACNVSVDISNEAPVNFSIGDYIIYRGERFEINYDPGKIKAASKDATGEAFKYESVTFNSMVDELVRAEFLDVVLNDNESHYTSLPVFVFYVTSIDDILDRLQANMDEQYGKGVWHFYSSDYKRSVTDRHCDEATWQAMYGTDTKTDVKDSTSLSVSSQTVWEVLGLVNTQFDVNFTVRGRNVFVGIAGVVADHIFKYGKGNGLYQIEETADDSQAVITRLRAYGNTTNMPTRYYAEVGARCMADIKEIEHAKDYCKLYLYLETKDLNGSAFTTNREYIVQGSGQTKPTVVSTDYVVKVTYDDITAITGYLSTDSKGTYFYSEYKGTQTDNGDEPSKENLETFLDGLTADKRLYFTEGVKRSKFPTSNIAYTSDLPNNMAISRLMLPGFPNESLQAWWNRQSDEKKAWLNPGGRKHKFSTDQYRPYVESLAVDEIGIRPTSVFFDSDNEKEGLKDIFPTLEEMQDGKIRLDEIDTGTETEITDDGVYKDGQTVPNFNIYLKKEINFDLKTLANDDFTVNMKDGMCGGRSFKVAAVVKDADGRWRLRLERENDSSLDLYFPYKDFPIKAGDHFVLTGLDMPEDYVAAASEKLLKYAIAKLDDNDYTRKTYTPKVDEIYMARQNDEAEADKTGKTKSLYKTLKEGDIMQFEDADLGIDTRITIEKLSIKEQEGKIPTYEITLKEEKDVGTIQKMQNQISSIVSGSTGVGGFTNGQIKDMVVSAGKEYFLSKLGDDKARGLITFLKGLGIGERHSISENGDAILGNVVLDRVHDSDSTETDRTIIGGQGFDLYMGEDGKSHLYIDYLTARVKAYFAQLEIRKISYSGGTTLFSNAGSTIAKVVAVYDAGQKDVVAYKCYAVADDGDTRTANWWKVGMMALCQTFNVAGRGNAGAQGNRYYWRMVVGTGQETLEDGKVYDYVLLSDVKTFKGSDGIVPQYGTQLLADKDGKVLAFAGFAIGVTGKGGMTSVASAMAADGITKDDGGSSISGRTFYGYDEGSDVPLPGDVIVQAGDEIRWNSYGNVIKLATSTEDNATDNAPSITMYHGIGKERDGGVWQWKDVVSLQSPSGWVVNAERFSFFTGSINDLTSLSSLAQDVSDADGKISDLRKYVDDDVKKIAEEAQNTANEANSTASGAASGVETVKGQITTINGTIDGLSSTVGELTTTVNGNGTEIGKLQTKVSNVEQKADRISLKVDQQAVRDRNLLPNSYFMHGSGIYGVCHRRVRLEKRKCYALSVWGRIDTTLKARGGNLRACLYTYNSAGVWTWTKDLHIDSTTETVARVNFNDVPSDGEYSFSVYPSPQKGNGGKIFIRCAQVEEIPSLNDEGTAWTVGMNDPAAYGNILPALGEWTLAQGCTLTPKDVSIDGHLLDVAYGKALEGQLDIIGYNGKLSVAQGESYALSFWAKGTGTFMSYLYNGDMCSWAIRDDGAESQNVDGSISPWRELTSEWKRYWVVFSVQTTKDDARLLPLRLAKGGEAWIAGVKLEPFGRMTEYTDIPISSEDLKATGIDILNRKIIVTADQFQIRNNKGEETFAVDADGHVTMNYVSIGGMINKQSVDINGSAVFNTLFNSQQNIFTNQWSAVPKMNYMFGIYYFTGSTGKSLANYPLYISLPSAYVYSNDDKEYYASGDVYDKDGKLDSSLLKAVRAMVGNTVLIYNDSNEDIEIGGMSCYFEEVWLPVSSQSAVNTKSFAAVQTTISTQASVSTSPSQGGAVSDATNGLEKPIGNGTIRPNQRYAGRRRNEMAVTLKGGKHQFVSMTCVCEVGASGWENIYWLVNYGQGFDT